MGRDEQFQQGPGVFKGYGVTVGFEGDPATVSRTHPTTTTDVVAGQRQGLKGWLFLLEGVTGSFTRLAMDSDVSYLFHPTAHLGIERFQRANLQTIEEVFLDVSSRAPEG